MYKMANIVSKGFINATVADYNTGSYIFMPEFQQQWVDLLRRDYTILNRIQSLPATGHPTRYWQQALIAKNAKFVDPRSLSGNFSSMNEDRQRTEHYAPIKAMESRLTFTLFDRQVVQQQQEMAFLLAKDEADWMVDFLQFKNDKLWNGLANKVDAPDNATTAERLDYCGILNQISTTATVAEGATIADTIRTNIANRKADQTYAAFPTAIYANPVTIDLLEQEVQSLGYNFHQYDYEIIPGIVVSRIATQNGFLPIIADPWIAVLDKSTYYQHRFVLVNEGLIERHWIGSSEPQVYQMGMTDSILNDRIAVCFDTVIVKGYDKAHVIISKNVDKA
jgi:hypothetical protein